MSSAPLAKLQTIMLALPRARTSHWVQFSPGRATAPEMRQIAPVDSAESGRGILIGLLASAP
jgi:hypothetical protein